MKQATITKLAAANILLQMGDGLASFSVLSAGAPEDALMVAAVAHSNPFGGLLYSKVLACLAVLILFMLRKRVEASVAHGLTIMGCVYSFLAVLLIMKMIVLLA